MVLYNGELKNTKTYHLMSNMLFSSSCFFNLECDSMQSCRPASAIALSIISGWSVTSPTLLYFP